jgi:hypothetical protein
MAARLMGYVSASNTPTIVHKQMVVMVVHRLVVVRVLMLVQEPLALFKATTAQMVALTQQVLQVVVAVLVVQQQIKMVAQVKPLA